MRQIIKYALLLITVSTNLGLYDSNSTQDDNWRRRNDRGNRYEGLISISTGNPDLEVLAFTGFLESFSRNVVLKVRFFYPDNGALTLIAREIDEQRQYWMEAKPRDWQPKTWNEFTPWPTGDVIRREGISSENLGVLITTNGGSQLIPAFTYHSRVPDSVSKYTMYLRSNKNLKRVKFTLSGVGIGSTPISRSGYIGPQAANVAFPVTFDVRGVKEGFIRVVIERTLRDNPQSLPIREYVFYHKPSIRG